MAPISNSSETPSAQPVKEDISSRHSSKALTKFSETFEYLQLL